MKKIFLLVIATITFFTNYSQSGGIKASLGLGSTPNSIKIFLRPDVTNANAVISTLNIAVAIPSTITPRPSLSVVSSGIAALPTSSWILSQQSPFVENGYAVYLLIANNSLEVDIIVSLFFFTLSFMSPPK